MEPEVLELIHQPPELRLVPEGHHEMCVTQTRRLFFDLADKTAPSAGPEPVQAAIEVQTLGGNPMRLSSGLGARLIVTSHTSTPVRLGIYDAAGRLIAEPLRDATVVSSFVVHWDGLDTHGSRVAPGAYFYRAVAGTTVASGRILVIR